jgi:hypothetical protein
MSDFLNKLRIEFDGAKERFLEAQKKFTGAQAESQAATQRLQAAQTEFQLAAQEFNSYQTLVNLWTRKEQELTVKASDTLVVSDALASTVESASTSATSPSPEINKTEMVRELLRQHPTGITPSDIWTKMDKQMKNRAYLYSVLKRLKDRGDARERRGKYFLNPKIEENQNQGMVVQ